jgi:hypothetical protein
MGGFVKLLAIPTAVFLLAACSQTAAVPAPSTTATTTPPPSVESSEPTPEASTPTPTPTPTPSPSEMDVRAAGEYYLEVVCPSNTASEKVGKARDENGTFFAPRVQKAAAKAAEVFRTAAGQLDNPPAPWPADVQGPVEKVTKSLLGAMAGLQRIASAENVSQANFGYSEFVAGSPKPTQLVRLRLNLPPAGPAGTEDGCPS